MLKLLNDTLTLEWNARNALLEATYVWWPALDVEIEKVKSRHVCESNRNRLGPRFLRRLIMEKLMESNKYDGLGFVLNDIAS